MGKGTTKSKVGGGLGVAPESDGDALSLHSQYGGPGSGSRGSSSNNSHRYLDNDYDAPELASDDLPPLYSDIAADDAQQALLPQSGGPGIDGSDLDRLAQSVAPNSYVSSGSYGLTTLDKDPQYYVINSEVDRDPEKLAAFIRDWAALPLRQFVHLRGTHTKTVQRSDKKTENEEVVDFDIRVELAPYLYSDAQRQASLMRIGIVGNLEKARRGTVFKCLGPVGSAGVDVETAVRGIIPTLEQWCERFCADRSSLKAFEIERKMVGFDFEQVTGLLRRLVAGTRYRGHLQIDYPVENRRLDILNNHRFNRWRVNRWIQLLCFATLTFLFVWPFLFFRTKRYEVVKVLWPFSETNPQTGERRFVSISESQWYNLWGRAIGQAVLDKRQGTLDQDDLRAAEGARPSFQSIQTGHQGVDNAANLVQASISAIGSLNRQQGWGGDS